MLKLEKD